MSIGTGSWLAIPHILDFGNHTRCERKGGDEGQVVKKGYVGRLSVDVLVEERGRAELVRGVAWSQSEIDHVKNLDRDEDLALAEPDFGMRDDPDVIGFCRGFGAGRKAH